MTDELLSLTHQMERAISRGDKKSQLEIASTFSQYVSEFEKVISETVDSSSDMPVVYKHGIQSRQFMIDLMPHIQDFLLTRNRGSVFDVLDVGPGSGLGSELLASLYARNRLGHRLRVRALDLRDRWEVYMKAFCPHVQELIVSDIDQVDRDFDIVIASHVVEHVEDPVPFVRKLQRLARLRVFLTAPYKEDPSSMSATHISVLDESFIDAIQPVKFVELSSPGWDPFSGKRTFVAELVGRGGVGS